MDEGRRNLAPMNMFIHTHTVMAALPNVMEMLPAS